MILSFATSVYCWFELVSVGDCLVSVGATLTSLSFPLYKGAPSDFDPKMVSVAKKFIVSCVSIVSVVSIKIVERNRLLKNT